MGQGRDLQYQETKRSILADAVSEGFDAGAALEPEEGSGTMFAGTDRRTLGQGRLPDAILCTDEDIGIAVSKVFDRMDIRSVILAVIDAVPGSEQQRMISYRQNFPEISRKIYECLKSQNENPGIWTAKEYPMKGILDR